MVRKFLIEAVFIGCFALLPLSALVGYFAGLLGCADIVALGCYDGVGALLGNLQLYMIAASFVTWPIGIVLLLIKLRQSGVEKNNPKH